MKRAARGLDYPAQGIRVDRRLAKHPQIAQKKNNIPNMFIMNS
jgi:hypothetical protein